MEEERAEQEEALVALIEHRSREVQHLRQRLSYYRSQLEEAELRLNDSQTKLARLRGSSSKTNGVVKSGIPSPSPKKLAVKAERRSTSPVSRKPELVIPAVVPKAPLQPETSVPSKARAEKPIPPRKASKRKLDHREHKELIPVVRSSSRACTVRCETSNHISSQHKRKLRTIALCPVNDQLFVTSALDGVVNLWQVQSKGLGASLLSGTDCSSQKQRRWPEDLAWHPNGSCLFSIYSADGGDSQISMLDLNITQGGGRVSFLEDKPHVKGIINGISFMPWEESCFVTGGSDHAVVLWNEKEGDRKAWKPKALHRNSHSSAVMGVAGMQQKSIVLSAGADKRIIGFDVGAGRDNFKHQIDSKCMSVLPNPCDFNLFMVHAGTLQRQLRLFDIRLRQTEIHAFGWKQESSESQSALINQSWSPDGLYITSGSADPMIHVFDIRYNAASPSQSIRAHQKRVFKAVWLNSLPLLLSISSDLQIGLHKIT